MDQNYISIDEATLCQGVEAILLQHGFSQAEIEATTASWLYAEYSSKNSHGLERLPWLEEMVRKGKIVPNSPTQTTSKGFHSHISGTRSLGYRAAEEAVTEAIRIGKTSGLGIVTMADCYPTGCMGQYTEEMIECGLIGVAISRSPVRVAAYGATSAVFSTTGHSFGFPSLGEVPYIYDSSVGAVTNGEIMAAYHANTSIPSGVLSKDTGGVATSFSDIIGANGLFDGVITLAGGEHSHRTSGLAGSFELLLRLALLPERATGNIENYSIFIAINPEWFGDIGTYRDLVSNLQAAINHARPQTGADMVRFAGEQSYKRRQQAKVLKTVKLSEEIYSRIFRQS